MEIYEWLLPKLILLGLTGSSLGGYMFVMDAKPANQWKKQTIPLWISPGYPRHRWEQLAHLFTEVQNRTHIRFRPFIKERDVDYVSIKISTYGCYGLLGYGKGGERWINFYDECMDYSHTILRAIYQILGFQMIASKKPAASILYTGAESKPILLKFSLLNKIFIVDAVVVDKDDKKDDTIKAESATSMMCNQPNMEFYYWNKVYENLVHSFPYVDALIFGRVYRGARKNVPEHDIFHTNRIYKQKNKDPIYKFHHFAKSSTYKPATFYKMDGVVTGLSDLYCEDTLVDCDFLHNSRGHCNSFQEFRYILCARTCGMCGVNLRLYYISTHHPFVYIQKKAEEKLPICSDNLQAVKNGTCDRSKLHNCVLPSFRETCRRSCGYCPEQSRVDCSFVKAIEPEYLTDHPNYNYRCQYIRAISETKCEADDTVGVNPITDCMLSCGRMACTPKPQDGEEEFIEEDVGHEQIPVMELYIPQKNWKFATFGALLDYDHKHSKKN